MGFKLSDFDFSYTSEYVSFKDFEEFYMSVVLSAVSYREFLNTMGVTTGGVEVTMSSVSDNVTADGDHMDKWKVTFDRDTGRGIKVNVFGTYTEDLCEVRDTKTDTVIFSTYDEENWFELYTAFIEESGIEGITVEDLSGDWETTATRFKVSFEEVDAYHEAKRSLDKKLSSFVV